MNVRAVEVGVGIFVALGLAALLMLAMRVSNLAEMNVGHGYAVEARFNNVGGLKVRSPVTMAGVRVGRVASIAYDSRSYEAVVTLSIDPRYDQIPADSSASIFTSGLLGEQYVSLDPGGDIEYLRDGDVITLTQSAVVLEQVISQFLFSAAGGASD
jgi:phospholipid/cholesterol/gamma-HCH transport system substrate-binding protein